MNAETASDCNSLSEERTFEPPFDTKPTAKATVDDSDQDLAYCVSYSKDLHARIKIRILERLAASPCLLYSIHIIAMHILYDISIDN